MKDKFWQWVANRLPKRLVYFCSIRLMAHATTGEYSSTITPRLTIIKALKRWESA